MALLQRAHFAGMVGNILGHYDAALYGLLAPFIAPLFFDTKDPLTALILTYSIIPLGLITKPLGSLFFGWIGDCYGRKQALFCSLLGMAFVTTFMGFLPTYSEVGVLAPCFLALGRMLQSFCAAGESNGASIFILENTSHQNRSIMSSFYDISSISGVLIASGLVTYFSIQGWVEENWRFLFWIGSLTAFFGLLLRLKTQEGNEFQIRDKKTDLWQTIKAYKRGVAAIIVTSGFSYATYSMAFTLMNGYVPLVTDLAKADAMKLNTILLVVDMILLPCFGFLAQRIGKEKVMFVGAFCSAFFAIPFFACLQEATMIGVILIRFGIIIFGVAFAAPYHAWKLDQIPPQYRYTLLSLGCTLGSQLIGAPAPAIGLWLYQKLGTIWAPGLYLFLIGVFAGMIVYNFGTIKNLKQTA